MSPDVEHLTVQLADVTIHAAAAGPGDGPLVILLHGYPEFWYGWRSQIAPLASAGFRVIVPDQRGYNLSSKPQGWQAYKLPYLVGDVFGLADHFRRDRFMLAGHDWGGLVAWACAIAHKGRVSRLAILNAPHPAVFWPYARAHPSQILRSWYIFFMQLPRLPELLSEAQNFRAMADALTKSSRPGTFTDEDLNVYREAWRQPGASTAMINWYRALRAATPIGGRVVDIPVRLLWGARDRFLAAGMAELSLRYCKRGELKMFPNATHWIQHEEPAEVSQALTDFFAAFE
ncbi:MAG: alpha/beta hydrolase [Methylocapsa sp.]|nr:alpha/beta hydrolase [Methylocapsa sp.]